MRNIEQGSISQEPIMSGAIMPDSEPKRPVDQNTPDINSMSSIFGSEINTARSDSDFKLNPDIANSGFNSTEGINEELREIQEQTNNAINISEITDPDSDSSKSSKPNKENTQKTITQSLRPVFERVKKYAVNVGGILAKTMALGLTLLYIFKLPEKLFKMGSSR